MKIENGKTYRIEHARRGVFTGKVMAKSLHTVTVLIDGRPQQLHRVFCSFTELPAEIPVESPS